MSTNSLNWKKLDFVDHGDNYSICLEYPYDVRNDTTGRILKPHLTNNGYYQIALCKNNRVKNHLHHVLIWIVFNGFYDKTKFDIDHSDHDRTNNHIENLRLVSKSQNTINSSISWKGQQFTYYDDLPDKTVINEECEIYYCKQYDKFFRFVVNKYREIREYKRSNCNTTLIQWNTDNRKYSFTTTNFRNNL